MVVDSNLESVSAGKTLNSQVLPLTKVGEIKPYGIALCVRRFETSFCVSLDHV